MKKGFHDTGVFRKLIILFGLFSCFLYGCGNPVGQSSENSDQLVDDFDEGFEIECVEASESDSVFYGELMQKISADPSFENPGELIIQIARLFLGKPYVAKTLEATPEECLIINLHEVDCTTFVEYVIAMVLTVKADEKNFEHFAENLQMIRYRDGELIDYASRLHYFSEWLMNNQEKGLIEVVTNKTGTADYDRAVNFMSTHPQYYRQLKDSLMVERIKKNENSFAGREMKYIPKTQINDKAHLIQNGDIIAFTSTIDGLDVSHTAFAYFVDDQLHIIHASLNNDEVEISPVPLQKYLSNLDKVDGILVGRVVR